VPDGSGINFGSVGSFSIINEGLYSLGIAGKLFLIDALKRGDKL